MNSATYMRKIAFSIFLIAFILVSVKVATNNKDKIQKTFQSVISQYKIR